MGALAQGQTTTMILMAVMEMEAIIQTDLTAKVAIKVAKAKVLATAVTTTNQITVLLTVHQD